MDHRLADLHYLVRTHPGLFARPPGVVIVAVNGPVGNELAGRAAVQVRFPVHGPRCAEPAAFCVGRH